MNLMNIFLKKKERALLTEARNNFRKSRIQQRRNKKMYSKY